MSLVAIIGAGEIGGAVARALASRGRVGAIRLIDDKAAVAAGKALDLAQSGPLSRSDARVDASADLADALGASAVVLADPVDSASGWSGEAALALLRRMKAGGHLDRSVLVCAGFAQGPLMEQAFAELGLSRRRVVGSAPESLASAARALVALEAGAAANQVSLAILGRPPDKIVIPWSDASIAGRGLTSALTPPQINRIERRLRGLWPPGPGAAGTAAALFCESVVTGSRRIVCAFVSLDRDNGTTAPVCAWPIAIGPSGIEHVATPALSGRDQVVVDEVIQ
jgi:malate dehydrogenase